MNNRTPRVTIMPFLYYECGNREFGSDPISWIVIIAEIGYTGCEPDEVDGLGHNDDNNHIDDNKYMKIINFNGYDSERYSFDSEAKALGFIIEWWQKQ